MASPEMSRGISSDPSRYLRYISEIVLRLIIGQVNIVFELLPKFGKVGNMFLFQRFVYVEI